MTYLKVASVEDGGGQERERVLLRHWLTWSQAGTHPNLIVGWSSSCPVNSLSCTLQRPRPSGLHHGALWAELTIRRYFKFPPPFLPSMLRPPFLSHFYLFLSSLYLSLRLSFSFWEALFWPGWQIICNLSFCLSFWLQVCTTTLLPTLNIKLDVRQLPTRENI